MAALVKLVASDGSPVAIGGSWAEIDLREGDTVARLAKRACQDFPAWRVTAVEVSLYRVERTGEDAPSADAERAALNVESLQPAWSLTRAGIAPSSFILVRAPARAAGACACFVARAPLARASKESPHLSIADEAGGGFRIATAAAACGFGDATLG